MGVTGNAGEGDEGAEGVKEGSWRRREGRRGWCSSSIAGIVVLREEGRGGSGIRKPHGSLSRGGGGRSL